MLDIAYGRRGPLRWDIMKVDDAFVQLAPAIDHPLSRF